jgi:hypothetical protein
VHITPKLYLDLVCVFLDMLGEKREKVMGNRSRLSVGVEKIKEANQLVDDLDASLKKMTPKIQSE